MCRQAAAHSSSWCFDETLALQLRVIALEQPPYRHRLLEVHVRARLESGRQRLKMWIALLPTTGTSACLSRRRAHTMY